MGLQPKSFLLGSVLVALMAPWVKVTQMIVVVRAVDQMIDQLRSILIILVRAVDQMWPNFDYCGQSS